MSSEPGKGGTFLGEHGRGCALGEEVDVKLEPDARYEGGSTTRLGQFLAKWLPLLEPQMNDEDRVDFLGDLGLALDGEMERPVSEPVPAPKPSRVVLNASRNLLVEALQKYAKHEPGCDALQVNWHKGPCDCGWKEMRDRLRASHLRKEKLVRDKIPLIIKEKGEPFSVRKAEPGDDLRKLFAEKLIEEAVEFADNPCIEELADILEVFVAATLAHGWLSSEVAVAAESKRLERGGFAEGVVLVIEEGPPRV